MKMLINSQWTDASDGSIRNVLNPATGEIIDSVPCATEEDVERAILAAQKGKERMASLSAYRRAQILYDTADRMEKERESLAVLLSRENGKPIRQTREEILAAIRIFRGFAEEAKRLFGKASSLDMVPGMHRHFAFTLRRPVGVVAAIVPFNYPVELYAHKGPAALAAGNAVIVKPPSDCPLTLLKIAEYLEEAGLPEGAHQVLTGPGEKVGEALARSPGIQLISLTGSTAVGIKISTLAAQTLKKVHLELGGNDPIIVFEDADLERASDAVVLGRLARGNGQICCAVKRIFVASKACDEFSELLAKKAKKLKVGNPLEEDTDVGPLITEAAALKVEESVKDAVTRGAKLLYGGIRRGNFMEPTVLSRVPLETSLLRNEVFGPVAPIVSFSNPEEALRLTTDSLYGLQAAVFTRDISTAMNFAHRIEAGGIIVNWSSAVRVENLPFGGVKMSGHGRESIHDTLMDMTEQKTVILFDALSIYSE